MKTIVYLMRHSGPVKKSNLLRRMFNDFQKNNEMMRLSKEGKERTHNINIMVDSIYSSNYMRARETAEIIASKNNLTINVDESLGERKHGVKSWSELPNDFEERQLVDENYKIVGGESQREVRERMTKSIMAIIKNNLGKKILIVSHATAITYYLLNFCNIKYMGEYKFNNQVFFDGNWEYCECFKLVFDDDKLEKIELVR